MRISHKIILTVVIVITVSTLSDFFKIQNGIKLTNLFDELIESETPSLTSLIEIKSSSRQASLKAVEFSIHGNKKDKTKALEAINKVKHHVSNYTTIENQDHRTAHTDLKDLNTLVNQFISTTEDYLKISEGPSLSSLNLDESKLHKARKNLISITKNISNTHDKLTLEKIKSEARKASLKSIEFYLRGIPRDKNKAHKSIVKLNTLVNNFEKANNKSNTNALKKSVLAYTQAANYYLNKISERKAPVSKIYSYEEELNKSRKRLIHTLYNLIKIEQSELEKAAYQAKNSISSLVNTTIIAAFILTLIIISMGIIIYRSISKPITHLINATKDIGSGNFEGRIKIKSNDEIKVLADAFNEMTKNIQSSHAERQQALLALEEREQDLAITLDSIGDAVITTDANGCVTRMNPVAERLTGTTIKDAKNQPLKSIFPIINASSREVIENPIDKVISTGETLFLSNHTTLIAKDGTEYQIADSAAPIRDSNGKIQGMVLVFNDITEQYHMREEIRSSEQHLRLYREQTPLAAIEWNVNFQVLDWNKAAEKMFGYTLDEVKGKNFTDIMLPDNAIVDIKELWKNLISQTGGTVSINENLNKNGDIILCEWHNTPLKDETGKVIGAASIVQDVTERREQEEKLRRSQKMDALGKLTGGIAHDYNNMLGVILGYSELLQIKLTDEPELLAYIYEIHRAGERGAKLTKKLLSFSRQKSSENKVVYLNELLKDSTLMLEKTMTARINLELDLSDDLWPISIDVSDLEDAILNMSINAMHAIDNNGKLTIQTRNEVISDSDAQQLQIKAGNYVLFSITDTGNGMNKETKEKIFDPFFTTKGDQGTGLGLTQVYGFIQRSGGAIKLYSELDHGTRFTLYFPRAHDNANEEPAQNDIQPVDLNGTETILIVDDEPALINVTSEILQQHGYHCLSANNGKQALYTLANEKVDILLTDVIMPEMDGYELASIVQKEYPDVKIQMASGFSDDRHLNMVDDNLHKNLLHKPFHSLTLLKRIHELAES